MKIRVIHLAEDLRTGGIEHVIYTIAKCIDKTRFDIEVWGLVSGGEVADRLIAENIPVRILSVKSCYSPSAILKTIRMLKQAQPAIIHTHSYFANTLGRMAAIGAGVPVKIVHHHSTFHDYSKANVFIDRILNCITNDVIYVSEGVRHSFTQAGYRTAKTTVLYNGIDSKPFEKRAIHRLKNTVSIVASLTEHKGHRFLLDAMQRVIKMVHDARLWIIGDGPLRSNLEELSLSLGISNNVRFWGMRTDVPDILMQSSLFTLASTREGLPMTIIESMAAGLPVVAPNISGIPELVIDGTTGLLVLPGDSIALANALTTLLQNPARAETMGQNGRLRFEALFTSSIMMSELERVYESLITSKKIVLKTNAH
jgi:glycosyltransferase involved in cell wall biosynthesis